jgi:hypothetical protein
MKEFSEWNRLSRQQMKTIDLMRQSGTWLPVTQSCDMTSPIGVHGWNNRKSLWIPEAYITS